MHTVSGLFVQIECICRTCKNLFRSLPNFLQHKRSYCQTSAKRVIEMIGVEGRTESQMGGSIESQGEEDAPTSVICVNDQGIFDFIKF